MAVEVDFDICIAPSCAAMTFTELTGAYSSSNTTGWGAPNSLISSVTNALLQITDPSGGIYTIDLLATTYFPSDNPSFEYTIPLASIGVTTSTIADGNWSFFYYVVGSDAGGAFVYQTKKNFLFYCNSECCVNTMLTAIEPDACDCNKENKILIDNYLKATVFLDDLKNAARCYQVELFNDIQDIIDKLCANSGCTNCQ